MKKKSWNILRNSAIAVAGTAVVGAAACYTVANYLMKVAMDRNLPNIKNMKKAKAHLKGNSNESPAYREAADAAKALECVNGEQVEVTGYDGEMLVGHWHPVDPAKRVIIAMHGWRSSWVKDFGVIAPFWRDEGCSVLYVEQRGQNRSGGDYMGFGMIERYDCMEWVKWVNAHNKEGLPIYLAGVSMGASTVLMAAGLELPDSVHGIIADCGYTSARDIWKHVVENNLHLSYSPIGKITSEICRQKIQMGAQDYSTIDAMQTGKTPVLFIHGTDDNFVPVEMTYENYKACTAPKRLFIVPGAAHGMSYAADQAGYQAALRSFWHDFDGGDPQ